MKSIFVLPLIILAALLCPALASADAGATTLPRFASDTIDVFRPLTPNRSSACCEPFTYGPDSVAAGKIALRHTTSADNVYLDCKVTLLNLHPLIADYLLQYIHSGLLSNGFLSLQDSLPLSCPPPMPATCCPSLALTPDSQSATMQAALEQDFALFDAQLPLIDEYAGYGGYLFEAEIEPVFLSSDYVTYKLYYYCYTGGAHGNYSAILQTFNRATGLPISLADVIIPEMEPSLRRALVSHMASAYPVYEPVGSLEGYLADLNSWLRGPVFDDLPESSAYGDFQPITSSNFPIAGLAICDAGLVFTYEKYLLTPGACGCPVVVLTFSEVADCLSGPITSLVFN